jgi:cobalt/nickel transport system ATP-binding protein
MKPLLQVSNVSHHFATRGCVLDNVSFALHPGDKLALMGANGAGKTTLFHLLVGLQKRQSGEIAGMGSELTTEQDFVAIRKQVGLVFQDPDDQLFCPSVLEDIMFGPLNQGLSIAKAKALAVEMLEQLQLAHLQERIASELSGGEKRMVTLASVLVMQPKVLLLDEPTNALDSEAKAQLLAFLQGLEQAMIVISHDIPFIEALTNGKLLLKKGVLTKVN